MSSPLCEEQSLEPCVPGGAVLQSRLITTSESWGRHVCVDSARYRGKILAKIELLILDVDGVMTPGRLPYDATGNEVKSFHVQDGAAIKLWLGAGGHIAVISGRDSPAVVARAKDLGIGSVTQGVAGKLTAYEASCHEHGLEDKSVGVVGDDLLDLDLLRRCAYPIAVANAIPMVKRASRYVTRRLGGQGAVAEAVEQLLRHNGQWAEVTARWQA